MEHNIPQLRAEALARLQKQGSVAFTLDEAAYVGFVLVHHVPGDFVGDRREYPLITAAEFEIDVLRLGKWEWLLGWLSPYHAATVSPEAIANIALVLLGFRPMPEEAAVRINASKKRPKW